MPKGSITLWRCLLAGAALLALPPCGEAQPRATAIRELLPGATPSAVVRLRAGTKASRSYIPAPPPRTAHPGAVAEWLSVFAITYDANVPQPVRQAFQRAVDIWTSQVESPVTITLHVAWAPLEDENGDPNTVLAEAGPAALASNFTNAPLPDTWYPVALANRLAGSDQAPLLEDVVATFNSNRGDWYFGNAQPADNEYDFTSVALHEIAHGLGFVGTMNVAAGVGSWGFQALPYAFDTFAQGSGGAFLVDTLAFPNPSAALMQQLTGANLVFGGPAARALSGGAGASLFAPPIWEPGSSFSHLDETIYGVGDPNSLMTPVLDKEEVVHDPGPLVRAIFRDMGWSNGLAIESLPEIPGTPLNMYAGGGGINNLSEAVGAYGTDVPIGGPNIHGFRWSDGQSVDITPGQLSGLMTQGPFPGLCSQPGAVCSITSVVARGINDAGQVVGSAVVLVCGSQPPCQGTAWWTGFSLAGNQATIVEVPGLNANGGMFDSWDVNNFGQIVGQYYETGVGTRPFLSSYGALSPPGTANFAMATGLNDAGDVVGFYRFDQNSTGERGFLFDGATYTDVVFPGADVTEPFGINSSGDIVGGAVIYATQDYFGFLYSNGEYTRITDGSLELFRALGINDQGEIFGQVGIQSPTAFAIARPSLGPTFTIDPLPQTVVPGQSAQFTAGASGTPKPSYQWQLSANGGGTWTDITDTAPRGLSPLLPAYSGATTGTLTIDNVSPQLNGMQYRLAVTNRVTTTMSGVASLTVQAAADAETLVNGGFTGSATGWKFFATPNISYIAAQVVGDVMQFSRVPPPPGPANQATVYQETSLALPALAPLHAQFDLGNTSTVRKYIKVLVIDSDFTDLVACTFWLPPGAPLATYELVTRTRKAWRNAAIYFYAGTANAPGDVGVYQIDNVSLKYEPLLGAASTACTDPQAPTAPGGAAGPNLLTNGDFATNALPPWGTFGTITAQAPTGVLQMIRPTNVPPAGVVLQPTAQTMTSGQLLTASFELGNSSSVRKRVTAIVHDLDFSDLFACVFWLEPGQPLSSYAMTGWASKAWTNATMSFYAATIGPDQWTLVDNVSLQRTPGASTTGSACVEPPAAPRAVTRARPPAPTPVSAAMASGTRPPEMPALRVADGDAWSQPAAGAWTAVAGSSGASTLQWRSTIDIRDEPSLRLQFLSRLLANASWAEVVVRVDDGDWFPLRSILPSDEWQVVVLDLGALSGSVVDVQFVFHAVADAGTPGADMWEIEDPILTH